MRPARGQRAFSLLRSCAWLCWLLASAISSAAIEYTEQRQPCTSHEPLMQPFFGDLHVHTRYSLDASTQGTRTTPEQAYRFARGERLDIQPWTSSGQSVRSMQLRRPLDFAMVSDHAELFGEVHMCNTPEVEGYQSWQCMVYRNWSWGAYYLFNYMSSMQAAHLGLCGEDDSLCKQAAATPWADMQQAAERQYDRSADCAFTTFVGYEWTAMQPDSGGNLHRNVVFRNAEVPQLPITFIDEPAAEKLWRRLDEQCNQQVGGCDSLAIPHNANLSAGYMFNGKRDDGSAMTADYAQLRQRFEPVMEIMQKGGSSECYFEAGVSSDELCAFEQQPIDNLAGFNNPPRPDTGFARKALADGMALQRQLGVNPYQLGFVGSTDTHLGAAGAVAEEGYIGHGDAGVSAKDAVPPGLPDTLSNNPGGLAVLWAQENSRDALFEALRRRETYGTSGPRIVSRFFGGWNYSPELCSAQDRIAQAYAGGVPMGGQLHAASGAQAHLSRGSQPGPRYGGSTGYATAAGANYQGLAYAVRRVPGKGDRCGWRCAAMAPRSTPNTCATRGKGFEELCAVWTDAGLPARRAGLLLFARGGKSLLSLEPAYLCGQGGRLRQTRNHWRGIGGLLCARAPDR